MEVETHDAILEELVALVTTDEKLPIDDVSFGNASSSHSAVMNKGAEKTELMLMEWFSGKPHGLQFDCDQADLDLFIAYMKALPARAPLEFVLASLLKSEYVATLPHQLRCTNCLPKLHFRAIQPPYIADYNALVRKYGLKKFVAKNCTTHFADDALNNGANSAVYMCFIRFNDIYVVNMLPAVGLCV